MFVLTRKVGQTIVLEAPGIEPIVLTFTRHLGAERMRVGIEAPPEVRVRGGELPPLLPINLPEDWDTKDTILENA